MTRVIVSQALHDKLAKLARNRSNEKAAIHVLGKNVEGVIVDSISARSNAGTYWDETEGGCPNMPGVGIDEMAAAVTYMYGKDLIPCGIARISRDKPTNIAWKFGGAVGGLTKSANAGWVMITYCKAPQPRAGILFPTKWMNYKKIDYKIAKGKGVKKHA